MNQRELSCRGCLLGLAVGDAMGYTVDKKSWQDICADYGPNGLLGYDLANGVAEITSYTQLAAFAANGLLLGINRGHPEKYSRYIAAGLKEWVKSQMTRGEMEKTFCWLAQVDQMRRRRCPDSRLTDVLGRDTLGTPENPTFRSDNPGLITAAVAAGLLYDKSWMEQPLVGRLGAETVAFASGDPETFLSGAVLAYGIAGLLQDPEKPLDTRFLQAAKGVLSQFGENFPQAQNVYDKVQRATALAGDGELSPLAAMSILGCTTASECLAGAVYAACLHPDNFDEGVIVAVNHSGRSCAVGALTGAILGAKLGAQALPEFYLECLEAAPVLAELATDIALGRQVMQIFDDSWDQKYVQGMPVG